MTADPMRGVREIVDKLMKAYGPHWARFSHDERTRGKVDAEAVAWADETKQLFGALERAVAALIVQELEQVKGASSYPPLLLNQKLAYWREMAEGK